MNESALEVLAIKFEKCSTCILRLHELNVSKSFRGIGASVFDEMDLTSVSYKSLEFDEVTETRHHLQSEHRCIY